MNSDAKILRNLTRLSALGYLLFLASLPVIFVALFFVPGGTLSDVMTVYLTGCLSLSIPLVLYFLWIHVLRGLVRFVLGKE